MKRHNLAAGTMTRARELRREPTEAEAKLWYALREQLPKARFRRQVPLGPYFADFASHRAKLVVEVDGSQHLDATELDAARTRFLNGAGYRVLRFWNNDVLQNMDGVLAAIAAKLPSPLVGEGGPKGRMRGSARQGRARASGPHPHPIPPHKGEGEAVNLRLESV